MTAKRCIVLAGPPDGDAIRWHDDADLSCPLQHSVQRFLESTRLAAPTHLQPNPSTSLAKWRWVGFDAFDGQTDPTHPRAWEQSPYANALLEHSIAELDHLDPSLLVAANFVEGDEDQQTALVSFATTTESTETSLDHSHDGPGATLSTCTLEPSPLQLTSTIVGETTDLKRLPKAEYVQRMQPQTITVNLLVGIIAVSPTRRICLRRRKVEMDIAEATVGDETRAGFSITFWLTPDEGREPPEDDLRSVVQTLRPGNVVLFRSIALSSFRGNVYGQTLSKRFARNSTTLTLLGQAGTNDMSNPIVPKLRRVRVWVSDFVGAVQQHTSSQDPHKRANERETDQLPPDTQE